MYLEVAFNDPNKKVQNLYIYKEILKTSEVIQTTTYTTIDGYRYGFQGQERDDEVSGKGNSYTAEFWQYSPRLRKRWNIDPMFSKAPDWSPYRVFFDNSIIFMDPNGLFETKKEARKYKKEHDIDGKISRAKDKNGEYGLYKINDVKNQISYERNRSLTDEFPNIFGNQGDGVIATPLITPKEKSEYSKDNTISTNSPTFNNINTGLGAFGIGWSTKEIIIQGAVAEARGISMAKVNNISYIRTLSATGAGYMKVVNQVSRGTVYLGGVMTIADGAVNGFQAHHAADLGIQVAIYSIGASVPLAGWIIGGAYFLGDMYFQSTHNGMSITQYYLDGKR